MKTASDSVSNTSNYMGAEAAICAVFDAGCAAWNRGELDGYLSSYWNSEKTIWVSGGTVTRGSQAIMAAYKTRFPTQQQMGNLSVTDITIEVLTDINAFAFGYWMLTIDGKTQKGVFTVQLRKMESEWLFVSDHSSTDE